MYENPPSPADEKVERVVLCSGKVYFDLAQRRAELGLDERVALLRLEQLAPFPHQVLAEELARFAKSVEVIWCQEEPRNMGAWSFVAPRIEAVLTELGMAQGRPFYAGRAASAATATGSHQQHLREQSSLVDLALHGDQGQGKQAGAA
jgi:2-oxoglutarate dehydrogenase E1 component